MKMDVMKSEVRATIGVIQSQFNLSSVKYICEKLNKKKKEVNVLSTIY